MPEAARQLIRGQDVSHRIISPAPDTNGEVTLYPGDELVTQVLIPPDDPLLRASTPANILQSRRSRVAISGMRHDTGESSRTETLPDGSILLTQGSRNHNRQRAIVVKDGAELSALCVVPDKKFALQNASLLEVVQNMHVPEDRQQPVLLDASGRKYSLQEAQELLRDDRDLGIIEVGIPLQERIAILSTGNPIHLSQVRRAW